MEKKIKKIVDEFFQLLEVEDNVETEVSDEEIRVSISSENSGLLIGYHGDTLESLQLVLSLYLSKKLGEFKRVSLEIGDYKRNREEWLKKLAIETKERALAEGGEVRLTELKPWERRVIHMELAEDKEVVSESTGEGRDRSLIIKPR